MNISKSKLLKIIKEELNKTLKLKEDQETIAPLNAREEVRIAIAGYIQTLRNAGSDDEAIRGLVLDEAEWVIDHDINNINDSRPEDER